MIDTELLRDLTEYCFDALEQCDDTTNSNLIDALDQLLDAIATYRKEGRKKAQGESKEAQGYQPIAQPTIDQYVARLPHPLSLNDYPTA